MQVCGHCTKEFVLEKPKAKYCKECKVLQLKGALPFMRAHTKKYIKEYMANPENKRRLADAANALKRHKVATDPMAALIGRVRARLNMAFRLNGYTKKSKSYEIIGCSYEYLYNHIEAQFVDGMTWDNRNLWHIDHIIPISHAKSEQDIIKLSHYTNLQPLWAADNIRKSNRII
jgi:hypothetical protein